MDFLLKKIQKKPAIEQQAISFGFV